ncbi:HEPN domain-containing protein [Dyadobacter sandarakinus]|uniref:HEPN domain-containing protein n=1 Tax=Dyadobacter sandarakinus TaxID=2747268 RepID=A0ABX7I8E0_9BACT|nr:HEPN domain-containing protein [Dyadobacter sandarakinus]QRR02093.1 HEPN domain-containing protein [Dyadobacter sandarakinus]
MKKVGVRDILAKSLRFLTDAQNALERDRYDFAINRSYYSMFHSVQALLFTKSIQTRAYGKAHNAFNKKLVFTGEMSGDLGAILKKTFKKSQQADYSYAKMEKADAMEAFANAEIFFCATVQYLIANNHLQ